MSGTEISRFDPRGNSIRPLEMWTDDVGNDHIVLGENDVEQIMREDEMMEQARLAHENGFAMPNPTAEIAGSPGNRQKREKTKSAKTKANSLKNLWDRWYVRKSIKATALGSLAYWATYSIVEEELALKQSVLQDFTPEHLTNGFGATIELGKAAVSIYKTVKGIF